MELKQLKKLLSIQSQSIERRRLNVAQEWKRHKGSLTPKNDIDLPTFFLQEMSLRFIYRDILP
jgi:hypothetical protein